MIISWLPNFDHDSPVSFPRYGHPDRVGQAEDGMMRNSIIESTTPFYQMKAAAETDRCQHQAPT